MVHHQVHTAHTNQGFHNTLETECDMGPKRKAIRDPKVLMQEVFVKALKLNCGNT